MNKKPILILLFLLLKCSILYATIPPPGPITIQVNSLNEPPGIVTHKNCDATLTVPICSLREAILLANLHSGYDTILLPPGTYNISLGEMVITETVNIRGADPQNPSIIDGINNHNHRFISANANSYIYQDYINLENLVIRNFKDTNGGAVYIDNNTTQNTIGITLSTNNVSFESNATTSIRLGLGAAIYFSGNEQQNINQNLIINNTQFSLNHAGKGGALYVKAANLNIEGTKFLNNISFSGGGGLYLDSNSDALINGSRFFANTAIGEDFLNFGKGGAIFNQNSTLRIIKSSFDSNTSVSFGGALTFNVQNVGNTPTNKITSINSCTFIRNKSNKGGALSGSSVPGDVARADINIYNSTFILNQVLDQAALGTEDGSALYIDGIDNTFISYTTISGNTANSVTTSLRYGSALYVPQGEYFAIKASIVSQNRSRTGSNSFADNDCNVTTEVISESFGYNILGSTCLIENFSGHPDQISSNPLFGPIIKVNGIDTALSLQANSIAIDRAEKGQCISLTDTLEAHPVYLTTDQINSSRPVADYCDIGAVEYTCNPQTYYLDADGDGFGGNNSVHLCSQSYTGYVLNNNDCDDTNPLLRSPSTHEICDGIDNNCNQQIDEGFPDRDGTGVADCMENQTEVCDGLDNDNDGLIDEGYADSDRDGTRDCIDACPNNPNKTSPGICGCGTLDIDTDGDGALDCNDRCPNDPLKTSPNQCGCGRVDIDSDGDRAADCIDRCDDDPLKAVEGICGCGVLDDDSDGDGTPACNDACPADGSKTQPGVCGCGSAELDINNDGIVDCGDLCPNDPAKSSPGICGCGVPDTDTDHEGTPNCQEVCDYDPLKLVPGVCGCGVADIDTDGDGAFDCREMCDNDPNKTLPAYCGCGVSDANTDNDALRDCQELCDEDTNKLEPGICGCGVPDTDTDNDGTPDCLDECDNDPLKTQAGACGCGNSEEDADNDGTPLCHDACPTDGSKTEPGDCGCGYAELDINNDGIVDCGDLCPNDPAKSSPGICGCGVPDINTDGDTKLDCEETCDNDPAKLSPGVCGCGVPDTDTDGDGSADCIDQCPNDRNKTTLGICGCGVADINTDGDTKLDCEETCDNDPAKLSPGVCGCGVPDTDTDGDGSADCIDQCPNDRNKTTLGICGCGVADNDTDHDGIMDCVDTEVCDRVDNNGDRQIDEGLDCSAPIPETCDGFDNNADGIVDEGFPDTDGDGTKDCVDKCINDASKTEPGLCGCGTSDVDGNHNDTPDCREIAHELCNGIDDNGDGQTDEGFNDTDNDGIKDCVDEEECDGLDNDGDGTIDESVCASGEPEKIPTDEICNGVDDDGDGLVDEELSCGNTPTGTTPEAGDAPDNGDSPGTDNNDDPSSENPDSPSDSTGTDNKDVSSNKSSAGGCSLNANN
ncbi:hypothetical protein K1X76_00435 [bacterium]|nr:hypothetical protein [bacterium]